MLAKAEAEPVLADVPAIRYLQGRAEVTGLPPTVADVVLAAQAFHWFERDQCLSEFHRILKPGGWVVLLWNERDDRDPFTAAVTAIVRWSPEAERLEKERAGAGQPLLRSPLFESGEHRSFHLQQDLDENEVVGRALSASYAPRKPEEVAAFTERLRECFRRFHQEGRTRLHYETSVYLARRPVNL